MNLQHGGVEQLVEMILANTHSRIISGQYYRVVDNGFLVRAVGRSDPSMTACEYLEGDKIGRIFEIDDHDLILA